MSNPTAEHVLTDEQRKALHDLRGRVSLIGRETNGPLKAYAQASGDTQLIALVAVLKTILADIGQRCQEAEVGNG